MPHSIRYCQFLDTVDQAATDRLSWASTPEAIRAGKCRLYYRPKEDHTYAPTRGLLFANISGNTIYYHLRRAADTRLFVTINGSDVIDRALTFSAGQELTFTFDAAAGSLTIAGATTGDGTTTGTPWDTEDDGPMSLGTTIVGNSSARGHLSLPYAVAD